MASSYWAAEPEFDCGGVGSYGPDVPVVPELLPVAAPLGLGVTPDDDFGCWGVVPPEFSGFALEFGELGVLGEAGTWGVDGPALVSANTGMDTLSIAMADAVASFFIAQTLHLVAFIKQRAEMRPRSSRLA